MMDISPKNKHIDFFAASKYAFVLSFLLTVGTIYIWFATGEKKYGIDFVGGNEFVVKVDTGEGSDKIRSALETAHIENAIVQSFEMGSNQYSVRLGNELGDAKTIREKVDSALKAAFADKYSIVKTDYVGPLVGEELKRDALIALTLGLIGILVYVSFRFEMSFALGAVVALFHDVTVGLGVYLLLGHTLTMGAVAAALTVIGYSVNDTIVIFDKVREEVLKHKNPNLKAIMNESVNLMLSRTIITTLLTFFSALALLLVGGGAISDLSLFLVVGIFTGAYSTIYVASPVALMWERFRGRAA